jgi:hypothetical protein
MPLSAFTGSLVAFEADPEVALAAGEIDFADTARNTRWLSIGRAIEGERAGDVLTPVAMQTGFWFAVSAHYPGIAIAD